MKKTLAGLFLFVLCMGAQTFGYQQQGFSQYVEQTQDGSVKFTCTKQCILLVGPTSDGNIISIQGDMKGQGMVGYGYIVNNAFYPGMADKLESNKKYTWDMTADRIYASLPANGAQVALIFQGTINTQRAVVQLRNKNIGDKFMGFWKVEDIAPYSINLHYGPKRGSLSWPLLGLILTILITLILVLSKKSKQKNILYTTMVVMLGVMSFGGLRMVVDNISVVHKGWKDYVAPQQWSEKQIFDLKDYIPVTKSIRDYLQLDNIDLWKDKKCSIYIKSAQDRPFVPHWATVYMRPCEVVQTGSMADYSLYYNLTAAQSGNVILSGSTFTLFDNHH